MKIFPILSAALACGLIASSCAVKNTSLSRPVSSTPSENSSVISQLSSQNSSEISPETMVSSMIAAFYAASSAADQTPSAPASCVITSSASSDSTSVTYDSVSAVPLPKSLIDGMKSPKSLMLSGFGPHLYSVPAKNEDKTAAKVQSMLANAIPFSGTVPRSPNMHFTFFGYFGPCSLIEQTRDGHKVQIEPYVYFTVIPTILPSGKSGVRFGGLDYVPDLLEITVDNKTSYFTAHDLYTWLQSKQCDSDFDLNYQQKISVSAAPYKGK